jgi:hypothetical protein
LSIPANSGSNPVQCNKNNPLNKGYFNGSLGGTAFELLTGYRASLTQISSLNKLATYLILLEKLLIQMAY